MKNKGIKKERRFQLVLNLVLILFGIMFLIPFFWAFATSLRLPKDSFDLGIGMIHQHFKLIDVMTAAENIILGLKGNAVLDMKKVHKDIQELVDRYGFDLDPAQKVYTMSVSQKQTVEIVKMLYRGANILILDEPTAVLTPQEVDKLFDVLRNMRDDGRAIIIITHKLNEVLELSDFTERKVYWDITNFRGYCRISHRDDGWRKDFP